MSGHVTQALKKLAAPTLLCALTVAECFVFQRRLFRDKPEYEFALASVSGVLRGAPAFESWQQRFLGPWLVQGVQHFTGDLLRAFEVYVWVGLLLSNALLYWLLRKKGTSVALSALGVVCFIVARLVYAYRLEYPWDGIDVLLFSLLGFWAARGGSFVALLPLLVIGTVNHEIALFIPFWYLLAALISLGGSRAEKREKNLRELGEASLALAAMAAVIWFLRQRYYVGAPTPGPALGNELHPMHNFEQLISDDWRTGRIRIAATVWLSLIWLTREIVKQRRHALAAAWSLCLLLSIFCFGYVNETRLYLPLIGFWFAHAWPPARFASAISSKS